jgi:methyl-accepting chemotaxis protein
VLKNFSLRKQIGGGFLLLVSAFAIVLIFVGAEVSKLATTVDLIDTETLPLVLAVEQMNLSRADVQQFLTDVSATHDPGGYKDAEEASQVFHENVALFASHFQSTHDDVGLKELKTVESNFDKFYAVGKTMAQTYVNEGMDAGNVLMKGDDKTPGFDKASEELLQTLTNFRTRLIDDSKATTASARSFLKTIQLSILLCGGLALVLALVLAVAISKPIAAQIDGAVKVADALAEGDLNTSFSSSGTNEVAHLMVALQRIQTNLAKVVANVRRGSESVAMASAEIAQGNQDLSSRTESQASSLEQTAASMAQLGAQVKQNAESARQANQLAMTASTVAVEGGEVVGQVVETMKGINDSSRKIGDITGVIDGIAFQTNILALNAAVEAARAGEQGRGFAVVASEVRSLAGRSADAAKEIKHLINASVERVEQGTSLVEKAGATMTEVVASIRRATDLMGEINAASSEQAMGVAQVGEAVMQMDQATQQNAALVEEMATGASSLNSQAIDLVHVVAIFKLGKEDQYTQVYSSAIGPTHAGVRSVESKIHSFDGPNRRLESTSGKNSTAIEL